MEVEMYDEGLRKDNKRIMNLLKEISGKLGWALFWLFLITLNSCS